MRPIRLISAFFTVGGWTLLSRIAGFARDILIAAFFGAGPIAEAFQVAFALPNMFRRFFAEGAFNMAFVPMFSKKLEKGDGADEFASEAFSGLATLLIAFTVIAILAMPWLVWAMASGFVGDARFDLATDFGRICFPYILFISLAALCSGVLNSSGRFAAAAAAPVLLNIILVGAMVGAVALGADIGKALVWAVPVAGLAQLMLVFAAVRKAGIDLRLRVPRMTPELKKLAIIAAPAALAGGVLQINLLVGRQVASFDPGAIQWLAVADRLYQLPLGIVGIAIGIVLLPDLSRKLQANDHEGGNFAFNRALEFSLLLTLPATAALLVLPTPLVSVLFERMAFNAEDTQATAIALAIYALGLPAFVLQKTFQPLYFAREDTKTPFYYALIAMVVNAAIAIGLSFYIGYLAAAIATTVSAWAMFACLVYGTKKMSNAATLDSRTRRVIPRQILASISLAVVLVFISTLLSDALQTPYLRYWALTALVLVGIGLFLILNIIFGAVSLKELRGFLRRKQG